MRRLGPSIDRLWIKFERMHGFRAPSKGCQKGPQSWCPDERGDFAEQRVRPHARSHVGSLRGQFRFGSTPERLKTNGLSRCWRQHEIINIYLRVQT